MIRRPRYAAALAVTVLLVGQLVALMHEAVVRHVTCAEHGEQVEVTNGSIGEDDGCGQSHLIGLSGDGGAHEDCATARLLRTSTQTSVAVPLHVIASELAVVEVLPTREHVLARDVISVAPKTSPPV